jgi:ComF family protein
MAQESPSINGRVPEPAAGVNWRRIAGLALDAVLPPQCLACGATVAASGTLCAECWSGVTFLGAPQCAACGRPFEYDQGDGSLCGACARRLPVFARARAAMAYGDISRSLILGFKHGDRTDTAPAFGRWLARAGAELIADADLLVPVPLHWTRLFARRFNQAAILTQAVGRLGGVPAALDLLARRRRTPSQGRLGVAARRRNLSGAFVVRASRRSMVRGRRVLLIDDVLTTGATASACTRVLLRAGAEAVDVLTLALVVRPER